MEIHDRQHHATLRLLLGLVALVVLGIALYLVLASASAQSENQQSQTPVIHSSPTTPATTTKSTQATSTSSIATSSNATSAGEVTITNADMGKTIEVSKGEKVVVQLGGGLHWTVTFDPATTMTELEGSSTNGVQGVYRADQLGSVSLKATGAPICKEGMPCPMFLAMFDATILVK